MQRSFLRMMNLRKEILEQLILKYERSSLSKGANKRNVRIFLPMTVMKPNYFSSAHYQERIKIDQSLQILEEMGLIYLKRNRENDIEEVHLVLEMLDNSYEFLGRKHPRKKEEQAILFLESLPLTSPLSINFRNDLIARLENFESVATYFSLEDLQQIADIFLVLEKMQELQEETAERLFSQRLFQNTKRFQEIRAKIVTIIKRYDNEMNDSAADEVLSYFNVVKNPGFVYLKGTAALSIHQQTIDLALLNSEFSLSTKNIQHVVFDELDVKRVVTVENLTTFFEVNLENTLIIYLGGYHNRLRRSLLKIVERANPTAAFYHFGDIDAGGIYILEHLRKKTGIPFTPIKMDVETLVEYQKYGQSLTKTDRQRLEKMKEIAGMQDVIEYMLIHDCKLEQEIISLEETDFDFLLENRYDS